MRLGFMELYRFIASKDGPELSTGDISRAIVRRISINLGKGCVPSSKRSAVAFMIGWLIRDLGTVCPGSGDTSCPNRNDRSTTGVLEPPQFSAGASSRFSAPTSLKAGARAGAGAGARAGVGAGARAGIVSLRFFCNSVFSSGAELAPGNVHCALPVNRLT